MNPPPSPRILPLDWLIFCVGLGLCIFGCRGVLLGVPDAIYAALGGLIILGTLPAIKDDRNDPELVRKEIQLIVKKSNRSRE